MFIFLFILDHQATNASDCHQKKQKRKRLFVSDERLMWFSRGHAIDKKKERTFLPGKTMRTRIFKN